MAPLGQFLVKRGLLSGDQLEEALHHQVLYGARLGTNLVELGMIGVDDLAQALSVFHRIPLPRRDWLAKPRKSAIKLVTRPLVEKVRFVPLRIDDSKVLHAAVMDPHDPGIMDNLRFATGCKIKSYVLPEVLMHKWVAHLFEIPPGIRAIDTRRRPSRPQSDEVGAQEPALVAPDGARTQQLKAVQRAAPPPPPARKLDMGGWHERDLEAAPSSAATIQASPPLASSALLDGDGVVDPLQDPSVITLSNPPPARSAETSKSLPPGPPLPDPTPVAIPVAAESASTGERPVRPSPADVAAAEAELAVVEDRDTLIDLSLRIACAHAERVALFIVQQGMIQGVRSAGCVTDSPIDGILVPTDSDSIFRQATSTMQSTRVSPGMGPIDRRVLGQLGEASVGEGAVFPVCIRKRVVNLLYVDNAEGELGRSSFAALEVLREQMAAAYEGMILRRKQG